MTPTPLSFAASPSNMGAMTLIIISCLINSYDAEILVNI